MALPRDCASTLHDLAVQYLGRPLETSDRSPIEEIVAAERRLQCAIPAALRTYYSIAGRADKLNLSHNKLRRPSDIHLEDEHLVFMDENQAVVSWGFRRADLEHEDPIVWQRNNTPPAEWFPEELTFTAFLAEMFAWYAASGIWTAGDSAGSSRVARQLDAE